MKTFLKELKSNGGHLLKKIVNYKGDTMIYYRTAGSFPTDVKTKVFTK